MIAKRPLWYVERDGVPVPVDDAVIWSNRPYPTDRTFLKTYRGDGVVRISTVFLGIDHQFWGGPPLLYETMIFWPDHDLDEWCDRYSTRAEAIAGHAAAVEMVNAAGFRAVIVGEKKAALGSGGGL